MFRITIQDTHPIVTIRLEGKLAGAWAQELEDCWQGAAINRRETPVRVDLTGVTFVDAAGQAWLTAMHRQGAELIAADCLMKEIVAEIIQTHSDNNDTSLAGS
jgi:anti-anti-sigma regulatory factor